MAISYAQVPAAYTEPLARSVQTIRERLQHLAQSLPDELRARLTSLLDPRRGPSVSVFVEDGEGIAHWACSMAYCVWLRPRCFEPWPVTGTPRLAAVLFHELVHVAGGAELDAEAFENLLFSPEEGAAPPSADDWADFAATRYAGQWLSLDPTTGFVTDREARFVCQLTRDAVASHTKEGQMAATKKVTKAEKLGVRITVEFTGHLKKADIDMFTKSLGSVLNVHMENGGNGN